MALQRALFVHNTDAAAWARLQRNGMTADFSWSDSARGYARALRTGARPGADARPMNAPIRLALIWHFHQPDYTDPATAAPAMPWTRLHALKDYADMAAFLERHPTVRATFNVVPTLLDQLQALARRSGASAIRFWPWR